MRVNSKAFKQALREHILEFNSYDESMDALELMKANTYACKYGNRSLFEAAQTTVEGGNYIISYHDVEQQLKAWGVAGRVQRASFIKQWNWYIDTLAREIVEMINEDERSA